MINIIDNTYNALFFLKQPSEGRRLKDNYKLRLYVYLLTKPEGASPTDIADAFFHGMKKYTNNQKEHNYLMQKNRVVTFLKELERDKFIKTFKNVSREPPKYAKFKKKGRQKKDYVGEQESNRKGRPKKIYSIDRDKLLQLSSSIPPGWYNPSRGLDIFTRIIEKNKLYYDPRLTNIQDYFASVLSAFRTNNPNRKATELNEVINQISDMMEDFNMAGIFFIERNIQIDLPKSFQYITKGLFTHKHDSTKLEKFNPFKSLTFIYFYVDVMLALYESMKGNFEDYVFTQKQRNKIHQAIVLFRDIANNLPKLPESGYRWKI